MGVKETIDAARDTITVRRVYGEPYERNGVTVIPAASVVGGGGGGTGEQADGQSGDGGGFGLRARPVGAYVIRGEEVHWESALDLNRVILGGQVVAVIALLVLRSIRRSRR
ncbi:MAG: hypothetical protein WB771_11245 [Solirubrobacterales bacterium]